MTFDDILKNYRENSSSTYKQGTRFEVLMKNFCSLTRFIATNFLKFFSGMNSATNPI